MFREERFYNYRIDYNYANQLVILAISILILLLGRTMIMNTILTTIRILII